MGTRLAVTTAQSGVAVNSQGTDLLEPGTRQQKHHRGWPARQKLSREHTGSHRRGSFGLRAQMPSTAQTPRLPPIGNPNGNSKGSMTPRPPPSLLINTAASKALTASL